MQKMMKVARKHQDRRVAAREEKCLGFGSFGFTMLEMLLSVGIISILLAVAFVGVYQWRISLIQLENDTTAKEIYMAAQNHLALAKSQGLLEEGRTGGIELGTPGGNDLQYFIVTATDDPDTSGSALALMLPFGSIDETVRKGGSYILRYYPETGIIRDVFYANPNDWRSHSFSATEYSSVVALADEYDNDGKLTTSHASDRRNYSGATIGWYGGENTSSEFLNLKAPVVKVENGDTLKVIITDKQASDVNSKIQQLSGDSTKIWNAVKQIRLIIEGETSGVKMWVDTTDFNAGAASLFSAADKDQDDHPVILDNVTISPQRFAKLVDGIKTNMPAQFSRSDSYDTFIPGENLRLTAWVSTTSASGVKAIVAKSATVVTNSLFAKGSVATPEGGSPYYKAEISSFRHLSNLAKDVSGFDLAAKDKDDNPAFKNKNGANVVLASVSAKQTTDLSWTSFINADGIKDEKDGKSEVAIQKDSATITTPGGTFLPVQVAYPMAYDGDGHLVSDVTINCDGPAGLFGTVTTAGSSITGLELVHFNVTSTGAGDSGNAGALAASVSGNNVKVASVLVRDALKGEGASSITGANAAGGLIGSANCEIIGCAAAVLVSSSGGPAGGLVGNAVGGTITNSYSGGHTNDGKYEGGDDTRYHDNVSSTASTNGAAGGLVGISSAAITNCYSTCSAQGKTAAGGLVGSMSAGSIANCYAVGMPSKTGDAADTATVGAFVGTAANGIAADKIHGQFLKVVTQDMKVVGSDADGAAERTHITQGDANLVSYLGGSNPFAPTSENSVPYDVTLAKRFGGKYSYRTIKLQLGTTEYAKLTDKPRWLSTHYGDWPAYETEVINAK